MAVEQALEQFEETEALDAFTLPNSTLLKVELAEVSIQAKLGSMVAYQGDVRFEHAGSGGMGRIRKKAVTKKGTQLMKVKAAVRCSSPTSPTTSTSSSSTTTSSANGANVLAFDAGIDWDIKRVEGLSGMLSGGLQHGAQRDRLGGTRVGRPPDARAGRRQAHLRRPVMRDHVVEWRAERRESRRQPQDADRQGLGRELPDRVSRARAGC
jgi:uncharacterized protein (AIM24 family)